MIHDMPKDAKPTRYLVDRRGTPDPEDAEYFVIDLVHDTKARIYLHTLGRHYRETGDTAKGDELKQALQDTRPAHDAWILGQNVVPKKRS